MLVTQVVELVNGALKQSVGETVVLNEDLSNIVEVGDAVFNANAMESYSKALVNRIGKVIFVDRKYTGEMKPLLMDSWEFGSVMMKVDSDIPEVTENESWELVDGASYDPNIFYPDRSVKAKFYNKRVTFEIDRSIVDKQLKQSFTSANEQNKFISMLFTQIENALTIGYENLAKRTVNSMIGDIVYDDYGTSALTSKSGVKAVNLLKLYNTEFGATLTVAQALHTKAFLIFASERIRTYIKRLRTLSTIFNVGKRKRFTPTEDLVVLMHTEFASKSVAYAESDTYHNELVALPRYDEVSYWQGTGTSFDFADSSKIDVVTGSGNTISVPNIVCVMLDKRGCALCNYDKRVKAHYNEKAEFTNYFYKEDMELMVDLNENGVVFFLA